MAAVGGAYMFYKHKNAAQRNLIKRTTPTVQTINPAIKKEAGFHAIDFKDPRVAFKPIRSVRSFSA
jgi:hypothetical protein